MYLLKNYSRITCSISVLLVGATLSVYGESRRRKALREKNSITLAMNEPDSLARTLRVQEPEEEVIAVQEDTLLTNSSTDIKEYEVMEDTEASNLSDTGTTAALAAIPESILLEDTPLQIDEASIELYFENADLVNFIKQIEDLFDISFIMDDALEPLPQNAKSLKGNKITYRTEKPVTRARAWSIFNTFLNIAGFAIIPHPNPRTYRIVPVAQAQRGPVPTYIGVPSETLPETDELIRYVYFLENNTVEGIRSVVEQFRSTASTAVYLNEHRGFILTDIAYNIKKLMEIVHELDKVAMPESLSVLKLRQADAKQIKELYESLTGGDKNSIGPRPPAMAQKKSSSALALPENVTIIAEPRTNSLILLGPKAAREQIEEFVKTIDVSIDQAYSPVHTYQLKYANATTIAEIMNNVTKFGSDTEAGKSGGVRGGDKYMRPMSFIAEPATNTLIVRAHYEDFIKAEKVIQQLDEDQPQVAIEVLILAVQAKTQKELGAQIRSKIDSNLSGGVSNLLGDNIKFQTSGLFAGNNTPSKIVQKTTPGSFGVKRLLGNLLDLVSNAGVGNTIISMGEDLCGVWGIMQLLETVTNVQLVSNPFLIATNKTPAQVEVGQTRRVQTAIVAGATQTSEISAFGDESANLNVQITPQINSDGMIILNLEINVDTFTDGANLTSATKDTRKIKTSAIVANKQVLAIGGLIREVTNENMNKTPLLGDIPILGWLFKNKQKTREEQNLLVLISTRIIEPTNQKDLGMYNDKHLDQYHKNLNLLEMSNGRDPIHKLFFQADSSTEKLGDDFIFKRKQKRRSGRGKMKEKLVQAQQEAEIKASRQMAIAQAEKSLSTTTPAAKRVTTAYTPPAAPQPIRSMVAQSPTRKADSLLHKKRSELSLSAVLANQTDQPTQGVA